MAKRLSGWKRLVTNSTGVQRKFPDKGATTRSAHESERPASLDLTRRRTREEAPRYDADLILFDDFGLCPSGKNRSYATIEWNSNNTHGRGCSCGFAGP